MKKYLIIIAVLLFSLSSLWAQSITIEADFSVVIGHGDTATEKETVTIYGYGYGAMANMRMSQNIAQANVQEMLAKQASGNKFTFSEDDGVSAFTLNTGGTLQGIKAVSMDSPDGKSVILVSSANVEAEIPTGEVAAIVKLNSSVDDAGGDLDYLINKQLDGMMREAVVQALNEAGLESENVEGTVYITKLGISF
jgi:hypothetical protein